MDKNNEIKEYRQKISEFKNEKKSDLTIHQYCKGKKTIIIKNRRRMEQTKKNPIRPNEATLTIYR